MFLLRVTLQPCPGYFDVSLAFLSNQAYPVFLPLHTVLCFRFPPDSWKAATQLLLVKMMSWSNLIMVTDCFPLLFIYLFSFSLRFRLCVGWAAGRLYLQTDAQFLLEECFGISILASLTLQLHGSACGTDPDLLVFNARSVVATLSMSLLPFTSWSLLWAVCPTLKFVAVAG